jgi:GT2 family glycosyltransferase
MSHTAIVILNYNGEKLLREFLPSVLLHSGDASIIVADNGSTDGSRAILTSEFPQVQLLSLDKNYGFCGGYNRALKMVDADYYVLLNSDVEVTAGWLNGMTLLLDTRPEVGAVQPKILSYRRRQFFEYAGAGGGLIDALGYPFCRGRVFETLEEDRGQYNDTREIFWATGACLLIRAKLYHQLGGLDEDFFAHMEEIDLCWKIQRAQYKIYYDGQSAVYHLGAGTLGYGSPRKTYLNFRNNLMMLQKHFYDWELWLKLPLRVLLDWLAVFVFMLKGERKHASAVLTAHRDVIKAWSATAAKRRQIKSLYPDYPSNAVFKGSILLRYYLFGRKTAPTNSPR